MHFPFLKIVAWARREERERKRGDLEENKKREGREKTEGGRGRREGEERKCLGLHLCLSGMLITSHLPVQAGDVYVSSKHLLFEISVLALFLRKIPTSVFFHL